ncbi:MAG: 30S ribosomal protein S12 methylthiotransferase RimO [Proteobacteria bacterium]|uniref:Ribosomal protein uS12 methylthiotransferase RimO n=1 Tax=Candidatus Avisuccinivibrio stercorigallinarum TaxID=2840704 RepID=A0A9D9DBW8_9GAMM|nr:30S ribosomal protein S12 methylthiotransferase RimO [Candidatus Avisuccinivibrio stercorigallinarum]
MQNVPRIGIVSLGCAKNLVDSERLTSALTALGYPMRSQFEHCDVVIINTCGFIHDAMEESLEAISEALQFNAKIIVMGCLGARPEVIRKRFPKVAAVFGPGRRAAVLREIIKLVGRPPEILRQKVRPSGILFTPPHYAYLKIAEGCRHRCTFCIIPKLRGELRSRYPQDILREAADLKARGVKELLVIAQDSSDYGFDLKDKTTLSALCRQLAELKLWLRVHYVYPSPEAENLVELMAEGLVLPYLDVPLQHASNSVLKRMKRPGSHEKTLKLIEKWRSICPDIALRSTFIAGFPGETESEFEELLSFIKEARLDRVGCFPYSDVEGAEANNLPNPVAQEVREERAQRLMELQGQISKEKLHARIGSTCEVLIDDLDEEGNAWGRSKYEAPEVDGMVIVQNGRGLKPGDLTTVKITDAGEHDLFAARLQDISFKAG